MGLQTAIRPGIEALPYWFISVLARGPVGSPSILRSLAMSCSFAESLPLPLFPSYRAACVRAALRAFSHWQAFLPVSCRMLSFVEDILALTDISVRIASAVSCRRHPCIVGLSPSAAVGHCGLQWAGSRFSGRMVDGMRRRLTGGMA